MIYEKVKVPRLEMHVSHFCNLKCDNCNHFSNYGVPGNVSIDDYKKWNKSWSERIEVENYQLCGGEPSVNSKLSTICQLARDIWKRSKILLISNGFFLKNHPNLPEILEKNQIKLVISIHSNNKNYSLKLNEIKELINSWKRNYNFELHYRESYKSWLKTFKTDENGNTIPHEHEDIKSSFNNCLSKESKQLFNGFIYKCPPLAYLNLIKNKFTISEKWNHYLNYKPLDSNCSYKELKQFFSKKEESYCSMCAAHPVEYEKPNPLIQLKNKF